MRISPWVSMMPQTVSVKAKTGENQRGKPTYGTASTYRCLIEGKQRQVVDSAGRQVMSSHTLYLGTGVAIRPDAQVTLSTADVGSTESWAINPPIVAVGRFSDERGPVCTVLHLQ